MYKTIQIHDIYTHTHEIKILLFARIVRGILIDHDLTNFWKVKKKKSNEKKCEEEKEKLNFWKNRNIYGASRLWRVLSKINILNGNEWTIVFIMLKSTCKSCLIKFRARRNSDKSGIYFFLFILARLFDNPVLLISIS